MVLKIGILVNNFGPSQLSYQIIQSANKIVKQRNINIIGFYQNITLPYVTPNFSLMNSFEAFSFDGVLISTDAKTSIQSLNAFAPTRKIFYVWDFEWLRNKNMYENYAQIYCNRKIDLVVRSQSHKDIVDNCWNRDSIVVPDFNIEELISRLSL